MKKFKSLLKAYIIITTFSLGQNFQSKTIISASPYSLIINEINSIFSDNFNSNSVTRPFLSNNRNNKFYEYNLSNQFVTNKGHPNIDNSGNFYSLDGTTNMINFSYILNSKHIFIKLSPYNINNNVKRPEIIEYTNPFAHLNNSNNYKNYNKSTIGFNESLLLIHYNGIGLSYGNMSNWWGPGFHSSITLSSNSSNFNSYQLGLFKPIVIKKIKINFRFLASEMENKYKNPFFLTGSTFSISYNSDPIVMLGISRYHLSGGFDDLSIITNLKSEWNFEDAINLIFEPLFGQSKTGLDYTNKNSPGYDKWDQVLSGFTQLTFLKNKLKLYFEISSDDSRANFSDLIAHWDHTLGYLFGFRKYYNISNKIIFVGFEHFSTKVSNTMKFWRGDLNQPNYYTRKEYDFSTFNGRRFGAHSGSSSDDTVLNIGIGSNESMAFLSYNKERHGVKSMLNPEIKTEYILTYHRKISQHHSAFIALEYEHIKNFGFIQNNISVSKLIWLGYSFSIN